MSTSSLTIEALHHSLLLTPILTLLVEYGRVNTKATSDVILFLNMSMSNSQEHSK